MNNEPDLMPEGIDPVINGSDFAEQKLNHRNAKPRPSPPTDPQHEVSVNPKVQTQAEFRLDPQVIADANRWYNAAYDAEQTVRSRQNSDIISQTPDGKAHESPERLLSESEIVDWAIEGASRFNWNLTGGLIDYNVMRKRPVGDIKAMVNFIDRYSASENTMETTGRALKYVATDPLNFIGVALLAKGVVSGGTAVAGRGYLRNLAGKAVTNPVVIGAVEGGVYTGAFASAEEDLQAKAQERDFNAIMPMISTGIGVGAGATLGGLAPAVKWGWPKMVKLFRGGEEAGNSLTDSPAAAATHGPVAEHEVEVRSPAILPEVTTLDEVADHFNLDEAQTERLAAAVSDADAVDNLFERQLGALNDRLDATNEGANRALDSAQLPDAATLPAANTPGATPLPQASLPNAAALPGGESLPGMGVGADPTLAKPTQTSLPTGGVSTIPARNNGLVGDTPVLDFEVAPNPDDIELSAAWNTLNRQEKTTITSEIADEYIPQVLERLGAKGTLEKQIGGFEGETNPGLRLVVDKPEDALRVTNALGHVLDQKSMLSTSDVPVFGYDKTGAVTLELPEGITDQEIADIYTKIYELEVNGKKIADGHTTNNGQMSILNFTDLTDDEMGEMINAHLDGQYDIDSDFVYTAFPDNKENYGYGISRTQGQTTGQPSSQGDISDIREAAIQSRSDKINSIQAARAQAQEAVEGQAAGVVGGRTAIETSTLMQNEGVQEVLREAGADMVVYPEKSPQIKQRLNAPKNEIGMFSQIEDVLLNKNAGGWHNGGQATGAQILKTLQRNGVKREELEWTGLGKRLKDNPDEKFAREDVQAYLDDHKVRVEEVVADDSGEGADAETFMDEVSNEIWDDPEAYSYQMEDALSEFDDKDTNSFWFTDFVEDVKLQIADVPFGGEFADVDIVALRELEPDSDEFNEYIFKNMRSEFEDTVTVRARQSYLDSEPIQIIELNTGDNNPNLYLFGNDDMGYSLRKGGWRYHEDSVEGFEAYNVDEAMVQARLYANDNLDVPYGSESVRWESNGAYQDAPYENYREIKITLPDNPGTFDGGHFDEENVVAHLLTSDRELIVQPKIKGQPAPTPKKVYFIEEAQSDWHRGDQGGSKKGYKTPEFEKNKEDLYRQRKENLEASAAKVRGLVEPFYDESEKAYVFTDENGGTRSYGDGFIHRVLASVHESAKNSRSPSDEHRAAYKVLQRHISEEDIADIARRNNEHEALAAKVHDGDPVADAPFKEDAWLALTMKRAMIEAAEQGYEYIGWSNGATVKSRWSDVDHSPQYNQKMPVIAGRLTGSKPSQGLFHSGLSKEEMVYQGIPTDSREHGYWSMKITPETRERATGKGYPLFSMSGLIAGFTASMAAPYEAEAASEESSLDPDGTSMTYRVLDKDLLNFEKRAQGVDFEGGSRDFKHIERENGDISTHSMKHDKLPDGSWIAYPSIVEIDGELVELKGDEAFDRAMETGEHRKFKTEQEAEDYATGGYKELGK